MAKEGFSIDDLLNPKRREYSPERPSAYPYKKANMARKAAKSVIKELKLSVIPIDLDPMRLSTKK
ncbi:MAG: hypothetical protein GXY34_04310 [Syntrophomonadaceae bacterium]|nr:hypothetical protein [Syntrophomonadaceae bacterium]